jgi:hypothetical protein
MVKFVHAEQPATTMVKKTVTADLPYFSPNVLFFQRPHVAIAGAWRRVIYSDNGSSRRKRGPPWLFEMVKVIDREEIDV